MSVDLRYLRHFVAVAEELHFGRAAARLNMEQAPLSQSIQRLEKSLGVRLFERSARGTRLTRSGGVLLQEARAAIAQFEHALSATRAVEHGRQDPIQVGFVTAGILHLIPTAIRSYREQFADAQVKLIEAPTSDLLAAVEAGRLDLALVHPFEHNFPSLVLEDLQRDHTLIALPRQHPLARNSLVSFEDLAAEPLIFFPRSASPDLHDKIVAAFLDRGLTPRIEQEARFTPTILSLVSAALGYAFVQESAQALPFPGIVFRPLKDLPPDLFWSLSLAWKPQTATPATVTFVTQLRQATGIPVSTALP
jgi:DNA-binding transcriptional LysR family regulator